MEIVLLLPHIISTMKTDKLKYVSALILLLCAFACGLNFKQWRVEGHRLKKHISIAYSFAPNDGGYGNFEKLLQQELRKQGIEPVFDRFYLDCNDLTSEEEVESAERYLEIISNKPTDLILSVGDQATYALLSTRHSLLSSVPMVACNVNFPDEKLVEEYDSTKVYVLRDMPDFKRNMDFIAALRPHDNLEIVFNVDMTILGRKSFDLLTQFIDRKDVQLLAFEKAFTEEKQFDKLLEMIGYYNLQPAVGKYRFKNEKLSIGLCPFRYIKGTSLLVMMDRTGKGEGNQVFLMDKFDMISLPTVKALNIPSFSCVREGFGEGAKVVGGYLATDEISACSAADMAMRLMNNEKIGMPKIRDLKKEYVLDWSYFSAYDCFQLKHVPAGVRFINYPFYDRYRKELYFLGALFVAAFIVLAVSLLRMRRRSRVEHKNMEMLETAHKRLTLSTDGGRISLWNIQGDAIEFDETFMRLTGMEERKFMRMDFLNYAHPDDVGLLNSLYETLHHSANMHIQRVRFCFGRKDDGWRWYELRCRSLEDIKGNIMMAGIMQDIQEQMEREEQLILAKKMAENAELKQSFLNNMSHEIRTPLNAIVGFTNLLLSEEAEDFEPEERANMLDIVNHNNALLLKLINDVLEISRLDSGDMSFEIEECELADIVKEVYLTFQPVMKASLRFCLELDEDGPIPVSIDRMRFIQVLSNFLNNANKFTCTGEVTLGCRVDSERNSVSVYVKDTGKGIEEKELLMIFDRFYKTDEFEQGSGLGLSICKIIIERLQGRIEVESEVGKGSCFTVILPLHAKCL